MSLTKAEFDQKFFEFFRNDYLVDAYELYQTAGETQAVSTLPPSEVAEIESLPEVQLLKSDLEYGDQCLELLYSLDTWERVRDEGNIVTYCKGSGNGFMVACEMTVEQPIFPILALFLEIDLLPNL